MYPGGLVHCIVKAMVYHATNILYFVSEGMGPMPLGPWETVRMSSIYLLIDCL